MTKPDDGVPGGERTPSRCAWCRRVLPPQRTGRPRQYCSQACRQWHWVGRQRAAELSLREDELIVARAELDALHDELYVLAAAVDDITRQLGSPGDRSTREVEELLHWLLEAARPLRDRELGAASG